MCWQLGVIVQFGIIDFLGVIVQFGGIDFLYFVFFINDYVLYVYRC